MEGACKGTGGGVPVSPCLPPVPGLVWCESSHGGSACSHSRSAHSLLSDKGRFNKVEEGTRLPAFKLSHPPSHPLAEGGGRPPPRCGGRRGRWPARPGRARLGPAGPSRGAGPGAERGLAPHLSGRRTR